MSPMTRSDSLEIRTMIILDRFKFKRFVKFGLNDWFHLLSTFVSYCECHHGVLSVAHWVFKRDGEIAIVEKMEVTGK